jgi:hypothetical protein
MTARTLHDWIAGHEGRFIGYRVRVGDRAVSTVGIVALEAYEQELGARFKNQDVITATTLEDLGFVIEELAGREGWPETAKILRLHALGPSKKDGPSFTVPRAAGFAPPADLENGLASLFAAQSAALASAHQTIVQQARIQTRSFEIVTEALSHAQKVNAHTVDSMIDAERGRNDAEFDAMTSKLVALSDEEPAENPLTAAAADTLRQIAPLLAHAANGAGSPSLDADSVIQILKSDPALLESLKSDPRLVAMVMTPSPKDTQ